MYVLNNINQYKDSRTWYAFGKVSVIIRHQEETSQLVTDWVLNFNLF